MEVIYMKWTVLSDLNIGNINDCRSRINKRRKSGIIKRIYQSKDTSLISGKSIPGLQVWMKGTRKQYNMWKTQAGFAVGKGWSKRSRKIGLFKTKVA